MCHATTAEQGVPMVGRTGTTLTYFCATLSESISVEYDLRCNQLRLEVKSGDFGFQSDWQPVKPFSEQPASALLILAALEQWKLVATQQSTQLNGNLRLMPAISLAWELLEHLLQEV